MRGEKWSNDNANFLRSVRVLITLGDEGVRWVKRNGVDVLPGDFYMLLLNVRVCWRSIQLVIYKCFYLYVLVRL